MMKNRIPEFTIMHEYIQAFGEKLSCIDRITQRIVKEQTGKITLVYTEFILVCVESYSLYKHSRICSWNQPVLSNDCKVSCSGKQWLVHDCVSTHAASNP